MNNKKGFTLIELIMVIAMVSVLLIIFMPTLLNVGDNVKKETYSNKVTLVETAANSFIEDNKNSIKGNTDLCTTVAELIKMGYLTSESNDGTYLIDPTNNDQMSGYVLLHYENENNIWKATSKYVETKANCTLVSDPKDNTSSRYELAGIERPIGKVTINNGETVTKFLEVDLSISDEKNTATEMCISVNNATCLGWEPYKTYKKFKLDPNNNISGRRYVYLWLRANKSIVSEVTYATINYRAEGPAIAFESKEKNPSRVRNVVVNVEEENLFKDSLRYVWSNTTGVDAKNGTKFNNHDTITSGSNFTDGSHYLCVYAYDESGNISNKCSEQFIFDNTKPVVTFGTNGNKKESLSHKTTVTVTDTYLDEKSLKYLWTKTNNSNASNGTTFTNKAIINAPSIEKGNYYLCIYAEDLAGNTVNTCSNYFNVLVESVIASITEGGVFKTKQKVTGTCKFTGGVGTTSITDGITTKTGKKNASITLTGPIQNQVVTVTCTTPVNKTTDTASDVFNVQISYVCGTTTVKEANCSECGKEKTNKIANPCPDGYGSGVSATSCKKNTSDYDEREGKYWTCQLGGKGSVCYGKWCRNYCKSGPSYVYDCKTCYVTKDVICWGY